MTELMDTMTTETSWTAPPTVDEAWAQVMCSVQRVGKSDTADMGRGGSYKFRGVDAVVDAVGPALRAHGVTVLPKKIRKVVTSEYETRNGGRMVNREVTVVWQVRGPAGDTFTGESVGEAADSGDKSLSKAQSVAYRVFLLQALCIPTGDRDPDHDVHERASRQDSAKASAAQARADEARADLLATVAQYGWTEEALVRDCWERLQKNLRKTVDLELIATYRDILVAEAEKGRGPLGGPEAQDSAQAVLDIVRATTPEAEAPAKLRLLHTLLSAEQITGHDARTAWISEALGTTVESSKDLTDAQLDKLIAKLKAR